MRRRRTPVEAAKRIAEIWVRLVRQAPRLKHTLATSALLVTFRLIMVAFGLPIPAPMIAGDFGVLINTIGEVAVDTVVGAIAFGAVIQLTRFSLGPLFPALAVLRDAAQGTARDAILGIAGRQLEKVRELLVGLRSDAGVELDRSEVNFATRVFFEHAKGLYDGTDSHLPSEFTSAYPDYLDAHEKHITEMLDRRNGGGTRILVASRADVVRDADHHPDAYYAFVDWHRRHRVRLLLAERAVAEELSSASELPEGQHGRQVTDVGIWYDQYAALFSPKKGSGIVGLKMAVPQDELFNACIEYFEALLEHTTTSELPLVPELFELELSTRWQEFVGSERRLEREGEFLLELLTPYKDGRILDAAAGVGCESIFLGEHGFDVTSNEIGRRLAEIARENAGRRRIGFEHVAIDWRRLIEEYPQPKFDAVLVLGNSLCLLPDLDDRKSAVASFYHILKSGGLLLVDERNFPKILRALPALKHDAVKAFESIYSGETMYCGETVKGCPDPQRTNEEKVVFAYYDNTTPHETWDTAKDHIIGHLEMHPFGKDELPNLLRESGFVSVETHSDLRAEAGRDAEADFFTYAALKPHDE